MLHPLKKLLLVAGFCALPFTAAQAFVDLSINIAPPLLPVYEQPLCPVDGYLWTPGYWSYADEGYYWVPGAWVEPPRIGFLWTPGYWGYSNGLYVFNSGYWGPTVGFYGGVNYGFGYGGYGYGGGEWRGDRFAYNTAITRVNTTVIHNTYVNRTVINNRVTSARTSFNGGPNGIRVQPNAEQRQAMNAPHLNATSAQVERRQEASRNRGQFASVNHGRPAMAAAAAAPQRGVNDRSQRQEARVANGVADGQLSGRQGRQLEDREVGLQRQVNAERQANRGDGLTPQERQLAERREDRLGRNIYQDRQAGEGRAYANSPQARRYGEDGRTASRDAYAAQRRSEAQAYGADRRGEAQQAQRRAAAQQRPAQPAHAQGQPAKGRQDERKAKRDEHP